jgi:hypothetical protein
MPVTSVQDSFTHEQTTASDTWTITHNLRLNQPVVNVWVDLDSTLTRIYPSNVNASDSNTVVISFSSPQTGKAIII